MPYEEITPEKAISYQGKFIPVSEEDALKATKPPSIWSKVKSLPVATGETILSLGTGLAAYPIGLAAQAEALALGYSNEEARKIREFTSELYTYKPVTKAGEEASEVGGRIVSAPFYPAEKGREYAVKEWGSDIGETVGLGLEAATIGILGGLTSKLKGKTKPTTFPTEAEWAELKQPEPKGIEYKPKVEPKTLEVPPELQTKALPPGQGFIVLDEKPKTLLRTKPPVGKEVLISETGEPITPERIIPEELKTVALPPGQGFIIPPEKPKTILRQPPPPAGRPIEISPEGEPVYPEGVKPVLDKLPLTETEKMKAPIVTEEGKTVGVKPTEVPPEPKVKALKPTEPLPIQEVSKETPSVSEEGVEKGAEVEKVQPTLKDLFKSGRKEITPEELQTLPDVKSGAKTPEEMTSYLKGKGINILKSEKGAIQLPTVEEIKQVANRFREFWEPLSTLPQKEKILKDRGKAFGSLSRVDRIVDHVIDLTKGFSDQAKKEMFEASDRSRRDINTLPPEQAKVVKELITVKNIIGDSLVLRDMVPDEAVGKLKGQYIKFVYLKHLLGEDVQIPINPNGKINTNALKARKGLTLEQQKAIGLIEDISIADPLGMAQSLSNIVKYDYLEKLASDPRNVWTPSIINIGDMPRKYSEPIAKAQATRLARSTGDPHRAVQVGNDWQVMNLQNREWVGKRMGIGELNEEVELYKKMYKANPNSPEIKQRLDIYERHLERAKVATQNIPEDFIQMPTAKSWGPLAGTFLRKEVARDLMSFYGKERGNIQGLTKIIDSLVDLDQKATGLFKLGKVPFNLPTVVRNTISNLIQLNMSGMNFADIIKNMVRTGEDFINKPPTYTKAFRNGLFKTNWSVTEINEVMDQFRHLKGDTFADVVGAIKGVSKYYGKIDDFFKYTKLLDGLDNGLPFDKAIQEAQKWGMDYSLADPSVKWARKHFIPFASYQYKIAPLVVESAIKRPWVIGKYMALPPAIMALTKELYKDEMTEDDWKTLESSIPREVQRRQSFMIVPWKINDKWYWFDYSYFLPWGNYMNAISSVSSGDIKAPLSQFGIGGTPMLTALKTFSSSAIRNEPPKDSFSGNPLYNRLDEPIDKALKVSEYFYNLFAPSMVTRYGALGSTIDIGKEDRYGRTVEAEQAIGKWVGINLKEANPKMAAIIKKAKINALKDEYMKIMIDPNMSSEKKEGYTERFKEEIDEIMKGKD